MGIGVVETENHQVGHIFGDVEHLDFDACRGPERFRGEQILGVIGFDIGWNRIEVPDEGVVQLMR